MAHINPFEINPAQAAPAQADPTKRIPPHRERMMTEEKELGEKVRALDRFINTNPIFATLDEVPAQLMKDQLKHMQAYRNTLRQRIEYAEKYNL